MGLCVFDVYEKYYNSKTGGMSNIMGKKGQQLLFPKTCFESRVSLKILSHE